MSLTTPIMFLLIKKKCKVLNSESNALQLFFAPKLFFFFARPQDSPLAIHCACSRSRSCICSWWRISWRDTAGLKSVGTSRSGMTVGVSDAATITPVSHSGMTAGVGAITTGIITVVGCGNTIDSGAGGTISPKRSGVVV